MACQVLYWDRDETAGPIQNKNTVTFVNTGCSMSAELIVLLEASVREQAPVWCVLLPLLAFLITVYDLRAPAPGLGPVEISSPAHQ